ncbi:efflux RND transporter permease subunit [Metabacillus sp. RGM 3146]|uniref:efflux RND transporter permease subunit n=1 Tax=Metabacillus sp. RGM 3146 TaxID=3401092 RepID=UPI003B9DB3EF
MSLLTKFSLKNRAAIIIMVFLVGVLGVYSGAKLPMELLPSLDSPMINVTSFGQGMDAETMADEVTAPLEKELKNVKHLDTITSSTSEGVSQISMTFDSGTDMKEAGRDIEKITNQASLPQGFQKPVVSQLNTSMIPIVQIALESKNGFTKDTEEKIDNNLISDIQDIDGVSTVLNYGKSVTELAVKVDSKKIEEKKIAPQQIMMALQAQNASIPSGQVSVDGKTNAVRVLGQVKNIEQVKNAIIVPGVKLKDIANVKIEQYYEADTRVNGKNALLLVVSKEASANAVEVSKKVEAKVEELKKDYKSLFDMRIISSNGETVENAVFGMAREVLFGALAATIVIFLFLRNVRTTLITVVSIPLSLLITLFLLDQSHVTLNILTLGGIAVAVGRLVDDSIVVIENIYRKIQQEGRSFEVIYGGTKEVAVAITSSTLTTIAVFLPMIFAGGGIGDLSYSLILAVVYSILASLLVAFTVVPLMSFGLLKNIKHKETKPLKSYTNILNWSLNHKWIVILLSILIFAGSITAYATIPQSNINTEDQSMMTVTMKFPADYDQFLAKAKAKNLETKLLKEDKLKDLFFRMGASKEDAKYSQLSTDNVATFQLLFKKGKDTEKFISDVKKLAGDYKPASIEAAKASFGSFGGGSGLELNITAANQEDLKKSAKIVTEKLKNISGLDKIKNNFEDLQKEWVVNVNQNKALPLGLNYPLISGDISASLGKVPAGEMKVGDEKLQVQLTPSKKPENENELLNSFIYSQAGPIPLKKIANVEKQDIKTMVYHKDGKETVQVTADITGKDLRAVGTKIDELIKKTELPAGAKIQMAGATESMQKNFMDLFKIMGIAILVVYLIMVITFGQARAPFAILFSLPLAAVGAILGLIVSRTTVDISSLIGALMLIGIVVTNAIVLIERVQQNRIKGMEVREALLEAGSIRLRPIIMTAVTTIVAMAPLLFGEQEAGSLVSKSLAVVVIGGLSVSTALTLIVVPVMYELLNRKKKKKAKHKDQQEIVA